MVSRISVILSTALISHGSVTLALRCYFNWKPRNWVKSFMNILPSVVISFITEAFTLTVKLNVF